MLLCRAEDGSLLLSKVILWAFRLNEGDLLTVSEVEGADTFRCQFRSYGMGVSIIADGIGQPWPFIEKMLRQPMAAVGPQGALLLPEEAAPLAAPGGALLRVWPGLEDGFSLEQAAGRISSPGLFLRATYALPLEDGCQVRLPEDVLWVLDLHEGDVLAYRTLLGMADFEPFARDEPLKGRGLADLRPGGALLLPRPLLRDLQPDWRMELIVSFHPKPGFRLGYAVA
ncbi:MAG TPA: hypothetical protein VGX68_29075 [Thermoanaerobaculia bacterium]|jgi:hypothetical protein|nr:hypothetical protein [Thermoanaerobaculia bacterium]